MAQWSTNHKTIRQFNHMTIAVMAVISTLLTTIPSLAYAQDSNVGEVLEPDPAFAESLPDDEFSWAEVTDVLETGEQQFDDVTLPFQKIQVKVRSGVEKGTTLEFEHGKQFSIAKSQLVRKGSQIVLGKTYKVNGTSSYFVADVLRLPVMAVLGLIFVALVVFVAGKRGLSAFAGLAISIAVLMYFVVPKILAGSNPMLISLVGASVIAIVSIYLAHGFSRQTSTALCSTLLTLVIAVLLSWLFVSLMKLSGTGSEQAYLLQLGRADPLDLRGLLLGGIIIGVLGVLDDVTTAQTAAVAELQSANPNLSRAELYRRGLRIGSEHILSLVNTLVLAYAGAALPIFLFFELNTTLPTWFILNGEFLAEEIVRTLVGSVTLVLAVPLATYIAAMAYTRAHK